MEWNAILRKCVRNISTLLFTSEGSVSSRSASMVVVAKGIVSKQNTMATAYIFIKTEGVEGRRMPASGLGLIIVPNNLLFAKSALPDRNFGSLLSFRLT